MHLPVQNGEEVFLQGSRLKIKRKAGETPLSFYNIKGVYMNKCKYFNCDLDKCQGDCEYCELSCNVCRYCQDIDDSGDLKDCVYGNFVKEKKYDKTKIQHSYESCING